VTEGIAAMMVSFCNSTAGMVSEVVNEMQEISEDVFFLFPFISVRKHGNRIYRADTDMYKL
jgi:hypothetical protein